MISYPAPELCQLSDEEVLRALGGQVYPGFVQRSTGESGLRLWVEGTRPDDDSRILARFQFRVLLGALRSWRPSAGELHVEMVDGLGSAGARDHTGNRWIGGVCVLVHDLGGDPHLTFGRDLATAVSGNTNLVNAFWLYGRTSRNAADF